MSLGTLVSLCWSKLAASTQCLVRVGSKHTNRFTPITWIRKTPESPVILGKETHWYTFSWLKIWLNG